MSMQCLRAVLHAQTSECTTYNFQFLCPLLCSWSPSEAGPPTTAPHTRLARVRRAAEKSAWLPLNLMESRTLQIERLLRKKQHGSLVTRKKALRRLRC